MYLKYINNKFFYIILLFISLFIVLIFTKIIKYESKYNKNECEFEVKITNYIIYDNKIYFELVGKEKIIANYYFDSEEEKDNINFNLGDTLYINGSLKEIDGSNNFNSFDYNKYLYNKNIYHQIDINKYEVIKENTNIFYGIKNIIIKHINNYKYSKNYLYVFILGNNKYVDDNVIDSYNANGVSHLFSISGMHLSVIISFCYIMLKKINVKDYIIICIILLYMFITSYTPSVLRSGVFAIFCTINRHYNLNIKMDNLLYLVLFVLIIYDPFIVYNIGFQFSYIISLVLIKSKNIINKYKNNLIKTFTISLISFLASLPICIYNFNQISIISTLLNLFFVPFVSLIIFPMSIITFFIPQLDYILYILTYILENISTFIYSIKEFIFILAKPHIIIILFYYILIILCIKYLYKNNIYIVMLIIILIIHNNILLFNNKPYYIMIDVGQGDSSLFVLPNNKGNILIDTGGSLFSEYDIASNTLIPLFKSLGIKKIDYLILTHGDMDHAGQAINLINNFKVGECLFNSNNVNIVEKNIINLLNKKNIKYNFISSGDKLNIDKYKFYFLSALNTRDENESSIVTYTSIYDTKILLMADAPSNVEHQLINKYNLNNIDILKVGHHGSSSSTSKKFIETINPVTSLISVGENNIYNHPNNKVINILKNNNSNIYMTKNNGSIKITFYDKKYSIITNN